MKKYKTILFDLDGTLLDTSEGVLLSIDYVINELKLPNISVDTKNSFIGPPITESLKNTYSLTKEEAEEATQLFRDIYKNKFLLNAQIYDGILELLMNLRKEGYKIGVATYKRDDYAHTILEKFGISQYCDYILGADFNNKMTKADIVLKCLKVLETKPEEAILIGDSLHDAIGAKKCGLDFLAVTYGFGFNNMIEAKSYDCVLAVDDVRKISEYLLL